MAIRLGREICGHLPSAETREWLVTNGIGGYASGTVAGLLTRRYHGILVAALRPPVGRTLLVSKLDETLLYDGESFPLCTNRWSDQTLNPQGYVHIQQFGLEGSIPTWTFACADVVLKKRIWMEQGQNTTYVSYELVRSPQPVTLSVKVLVNYRDHHSSTQVGFWNMAIAPVPHGVKVTAFDKAAPFYICAAAAKVTLANDWYHGFYLTQEQARGLPPQEDHLWVAEMEMTLMPGQCHTLVASTEEGADLEGQAIARRRAHEAHLYQRWQTTPHHAQTPDWLAPLILAADQFIVERSLPTEPNGHSIIAGYPWFNDWGRDTMISLPGLTLATGRSDIAATILRTYAAYLDQGMLPNVFPDHGQSPHYNTVDAVLWYLEALRAYVRATGDRQLIADIFPQLQSIIDWHCQGTRYAIHLDTDGLLWAGEAGTQLTWMDAKVGKWVVTPRMGKPVEVNALWYNALGCMALFAQELGQDPGPYLTLAKQTHRGFQRFWYEDGGYCYDVLDGTMAGPPDASLRPNQLLAIALPQDDLGLPPLLSPSQQRAVVTLCARKLLTSHGLRSLSPDDPRYCGSYGGSPRDRDAAYHQGTVWGWLMGPFVQAYWRVQGDAPGAIALLETLAAQQWGECIGTLGEIFEGDPPMASKGAIAQAWTVAQVLQTWSILAAHL